jgi:sulfur-carrier protein adenylyltransferase/sulfurtransferase
MLSPDERIYYQRQMILPNWGEDNQLVLKRSQILVIGAGGLGCPALLYLAGSGVGKIGKSKAEIASEKLKLLNPFINIVAFVEMLNPENALDILTGYDLILDCTDTFEARYLINDACVILGKPWVFGAIHRFEAQLAIFNGKLPNGGLGPTYRCVFPEPPQMGSIPNCSDAGVIGALPGIVGAYQASEAIKYLTGQGESLTSHLLMMDIASMQSQKIKLKRNPVHSLIREINPVSLVCKAPTVLSISPQQLQSKLLQEENIFLLDVREQWEFDICRIAQAKLVPLGSLSDNRPDMSQHGSVVVYCHHGVRSLHAIKILQPLFPNVQFYNLEGGIHAWAADLDPSMEMY